MTATALAASGSLIVAAPADALTTKCTGYTKVAIDDVKGFKTALYQSKSNSHKWCAITYRTGSFEDTKGDTRAYLMNYYDESSVKKSPKRVTKTKSYAVKIQAECVYFYGSAKKTTKSKTLWYTVGKSICAA